LNHEYVREESQCDDEDLIEEFLDLNEELMEIEEKEELETYMNDIKEKLGILMAEIRFLMKNENYKETY